MKFVVSCPAKVILFGEHFAVYNYSAIAAAIKPYNKIEVSFLKSKNYSLEYKSTNKEHSFIYPQKKPTKHFLLYLYKYFLEKYPQLKEYKIVVKVKKLWPLKGVGNSSAISGSFAYAIEKFLKNKLEQKKLFEYIQIGDRIAHGKPSGIDGWTISSGSVIEFKKTGGPKKIIFRRIKGYDFILIDTKNLDKKVSTTKKQVEKFAKNKGYLFGERYKKIFLDAKKAIEKGDGKRLAGLMQKNQELLEKAKVCSKTSIKIIRDLKKIGLEGVKITGAGGSSASLIALVEKNKMKKIVGFLRKQGLRVYKFEISKKSIF
ncbi:MAG: hypothetical protein N3D10_00355 [Candidatus Micrarchaeota archaeon]|nr:hypothetical protein [Candidatus Micrarchaeota archaeon]